METFCRSRVRARTDGGFTLVELLVAVSVLGLLALMMLWITLGGSSRYASEAKDQVDYAADTQMVAVAFGRDVQGAASVLATPCGAGTDPLVTLKASANASYVTYWSNPDGATFDLVRSRCASSLDPASSSTLAADLAVHPSVTCSTACDGTGTPRRITLSVGSGAGYSFAVAGDRRLCSTIVGGACTSSSPPAATSAAVIGLGGSPLTFNGNHATLSVTGNVFLAAPKAGGGILTVSGETRVVPGLQDPLALLPVPSEAGLTVFTCGSTCAYQGPGVYPKPLAITGNATFAAGTYVFHQGLSLSGNGTITGTGVVLINGCGSDVPPSSCPGGGGAFTVSGNGQLSLSPPTTGTYAGILYFQPPSNPNAVSISGNGSGQLLDGTLYAPAASSLTLGTGNGSVIVGSVVGVNIVIGGNGLVLAGD